MSSMNEHPLVSVIIPTNKSAQQLESCLNSINSQTYPSREIIVVDNYSNDGTEEISKKHNVKFYTLRGERAKAKNFGLDNAKGNYVLFIDSDMTLSKEVIEECVLLINSNHMIGGVIIPEKTIGTSFWTKVREYERSFYNKTEIESARFFSASLAKKVIGFDINATFFEESTLPYKIQKLGYSVNARVNAKIIHHEESFSINSHLKKKLYYGLTLFYYATHYDSQAKLQLSMAYRIKIFFNRRFLSNPLYAMSVVLLKFLEMSFVLAGSFISIFRN